MGIFNKQKPANGGVPTAGCGSVTFEQCKQINDEFINVNLTHDELLYIKGFLAGIAFVATPKDAETHGLSAREFAENGYGYIIQDAFEDAMNEALENAVSGVLKQFGIEGDIDAVCTGIDPSVFLKGDDD